MKTEMVSQPSVVSADSVETGDKKFEKNGASQFQN
jgi:hypothetical protein